MFSSFFLSKKWSLWAYGGILFIFASLLFQTSLNVAINEWYKEFYDILQNAKEHKISEFWEKIRKFLLIAMPYVITHTITTFFVSHWVFRWREAMTFSYISQWKKCKQDIEGSSQRIQEDIYRFAKITESLGLQIAKAVMTLFAFVPVLWGLSKYVEIDLIKDVPGSLVWIAFLVSFGGLLISWFVGIKLPGLEYTNQKVEAAFRKELVYAEDDKKNYANEPTIIELFTGLRYNYFRLFLHYGYFNIWLISFSQFMVIVPYLIVGSGIFTGLITLGILVQVSNAFSQVRNSFSVFIDNWTTITELRSIYKRLSEFQINIGYKNEANF